MLVALLLAATLAAPETAPTAAPERTSERLKKVQQRRQALEREIEGLRTQEKSLLSDVERLELQVRLREQDLREIQLTLRKTREEMDAAQRRADELEHSLEAARPAVVARARALYKLGEFSYVRLLLSIDRPVDVLRAYRFVSTLARQDRGRVARFRRDLNTLGTTREELEKKRQETLDQRAEVDRRRQRLNGERRDKSGLLTRIVERKEVHLAYLDELAQAEQRLTELLLGTGALDAAVPITAFRGTLPWPVAGKVRVGFGPRRHPRFDTVTAHNGIEIEAAPESPVLAVHEGTVAFAGRFLGYGLMVVLDHGQKHHTLYAHLAEAPVAVGDRVRAGDPVGVLPDGSGADLYFEMRAQGRPVDPDEWLLPPEKERR
jgi:septal ring factor EnvC (AmiA/AmiB activator)